MASKDVSATPAQIGEAAMAAIGAAAMASFQAQLVLCEAKGVAPTVDMERDMVKRAIDMSAGMIPAGNPLREAAIEVVTKTFEEYLAARRS